MNKVLDFHTAIVLCKILHFNRITIKLIEYERMKYSAVVHNFVRILDWKFSLCIKTIFINNFINYESMLFLSLLFQ